MTAFTGGIACDIAWARPATIPCPIINYSGPAFAGVEQLAAWGQPYMVGFESATTRAYAGGDAGAEDARALLDVLRTIPGYLEGNHSTWMCAADANSTPAWALPGVTDYFARAADEFLAVGYRPHITFGYGNPEASRAARAGIATRGLRGERWGIGTWREGEGYGANTPPAASTAAMLQSGNTPGPADGTDLDWLYLPLEELGFYGGPAGGALSIDVSQEDTMYGKDSAGRYYKDSPGVWVALTAAEAAAVYTAALGGAKITVLDLGDPINVVAANAATVADMKKLGLVPPTGAGTAPVPVDTSALETAIVAAETANNASAGAIAQAKAALAAVKG